MTKRARIGRRLIRSCDRAVLSTVIDGWPYGSLVLTACDHRGRPLTMISELAQHTRNIAIDPRCSLFFDGTGGLEDPLAGTRLTVTGRLEETADEVLRTRYITRHPFAWLEFADFHLYAMTVERAHLISGFGRIAWIAGDDLLFDADDVLAEAEPDILAREGRAAEPHAARLLGLPAGAWKMTGIDPEGIDLRGEERNSRLNFETPVRTPEEARAALARIAEMAGARRTDANLAV